MAALPVAGFIGHTTPPLRLAEYGDPLIEARGSGGIAPDRDVPLPPPRVPRLPDAIPGDGTRRKPRGPRPSRPPRAKRREGHATVPGFDGKQHRYLNAALPSERADPPPVESCVCTARCGHAYSHLYGRESGCDECRLEDVAAVARELEAAGIELGWGGGGRDPFSERAMYGYKRSGIRRGYTLTGESR